MSCYASESGVEIESLARDTYSFQKSHVSSEYYVYWGLHIVFHVFQVCCIFKLGKRNCSSLFFSRSNNSLRVSILSTSCNFFFPVFYERMTLLTFTVCLVQSLFSFTRVTAFKGWLIHCKLLILENTLHCEQTRKYISENLVDKARLKPRHCYLEKDSLYHSPWIICYMPSR